MTTTTDEAAPQFELRQPLDPQPSEHGENYAWGRVVEGVRSSTIKGIVPTTYQGPGWDVQYWLDNPQYIGLCPLGEVGDIRDTGPVKTRVEAVRVERDSGVWKWIVLVEVQRCHKCGATSNLEHDQQPGRFICSGCIPFGSTT